MGRTRHRLLGAERQPPRCRGFTIMELVIVVVLAGIIASVAIPAYQEHARTARRSSAHSALEEAAARQEQFFLDNKTYTTTVGPGGLNMSVTTEGGFYTLSVDAPTAACAIDRCYALSAVPQGAQASDSCNPVTLDSDRVKGPANCW